MLGTTVGSYRIIKQLAVGGMGEVYLARHVWLDRSAAVKLLLDQFSRNQHAVDRFFREAKTTAALAHPGIVELYDFGYYSDGRAFLIMELLRGESLKAKLKRSTVLPLSYTLRLLREVCSALGAAHASNVVHRDLKPDNIFLVRDPEDPSGERPKLLDFGIAKLQDHDDGGVRTRTGMLLGTPAYMSPEQCRGSLDIDARADLYSLGCIFYEMVCGQRLFGRIASAGALVGMHQFKLPVPPRAIIPDIHPALERLLLKLLEKKPKNRLQSTDELIEKLAEIEALGWELPHVESYLSGSGAKSLWLPDDSETELVGMRRDSSSGQLSDDDADDLANALVDAPADELVHQLTATPVEPSQRLTPVEPSQTSPDQEGSLPTMTVDIAKLRHREATVVEPRIPSIAVLPFRNMSSDPEQQYFCDGITEDIINDLAHLDGLRVAARSTSFAYRDHEQDIREIGEELGTDTMLKGSLRKAGDRLRITVQLYDVASGFAIWSERYNGKLEDVFDVQDEISKAIVASLKVELSKSEQNALDKGPATKNPEAYDFYLRGQRFFYQFSRNSMIFAREMFEQAIAKDPTYALAYSGLAGCDSWIFMYHENDMSHVEQAIAASLKAIELDPELAEAHVACGLAISLIERYDEAEAELQEAVRLNPKLFEAYYFYARTCFVQGKMAEAAEWFERAYHVNPENYQSLFILGRVYRGQGRLADYKRAMKLGLEVAAKHLARNPDDVRAIYLSGQGFAEMGDVKRGRELLERALLIDPEDPVTVINMCAFLSITGEHDASIPYLDKALKNGFSQLRWLEHDSLFDPIRDRSDYQEIMEKWRRRKAAARQSDASISPDN